MIFISNAFSLQMVVHKNTWTNLTIIKVDANEVKEAYLKADLDEIEWVIDNADTSREVSKLLGIRDPGRGRGRITLEPEDDLFVAQSEGDSIEFFRIVKSPISACSISRAQ